MPPVVAPPVEPLPEVELVVVPEVEPPPDPDVMPPPRLVVEPEVLPLVLPAVEPAVVRVPLVEPEVLLRVEPLVLPLVELPLVLRVPLVELPLVDRLLVVLPLVLMLPAPLFLLPLAAVVVPWRVPVRPAVDAPLVLPEVEPVVVVLPDALVVVPDVEPPPDPDVMPPPRLVVEPEVLPLVLPAVEPAVVRVPLVEPEVLCAWAVAMLAATTATKTNIFFIKLRLVERIGKTERCNMSTLLYAVRQGFTFFAIRSLPSPERLSTTHSVSKHYFFASATLHIERRNEEQAW